MTSEPKNPAEMRKALLEISYGRSFTGGQRGYSSVDALIRHVHRLADHQGLTGEDRYTFMAWHLMQHAASSEAAMLKAAYLAPAPRILVPAGAPAP